MIVIALWVKKSSQRQRLYKLHMVTENIFKKFMEETRLIIPQNSIIIISILLSGKTLQYH